MLQNIELQIRWGETPTKTKQKISNPAYLEASAENWQLMFVHDLQCQLIGPTGLGTSLVLLSPGLLLCPAEGTQQKLNYN